MAGKSSHDKSCIQFTLADYFGFVDWSGRAIQEDKRGACFQPAFHYTSVRNRCAFKAISLFVELERKKHYKFMLKKLESAGCMEYMLVNACFLDVFRFELMGAVDFLLGF